MSTNRQLIAIVILTILFFFLPLIVHAQENHGYVYIRKENNIEYFVDIDQYTFYDSGNIAFYMLTRDLTNLITAREKIDINSKEHLFVVISISGITADGMEFNSDVYPEYKSIEKNSVIDVAIGILQKRRLKVHESAYKV
jgi:hypothetical protein